MEVLVLKKMITEGVVDFDKLIKLTYKGLGLTEMEAFLLMELNSLKQKNTNFVTPKIITKKLTITEEQAFSLMDDLMRKQFLTFKLIKGENGKQKESFEIDLTYEKVLSYYKEKVVDEMMKVDENFNTLEEEIVELLEKNFQKQLKPLEVELIIKWINDYKYTKEDIKEAIFSAIKANRFSVSYLDSVLLKKRQLNQEVKIRKTSKKKSPVLKEFLES
ncbi:MAG: DnaD domain protein [Candidatus Izemoplasmatales bacterium]|nr:DnaD domain protein [Candidatus Izemoplasmatales bacterium]